MKKDFHVFFLFALFLLFAVNAAWAGNLSLKTNKSGEQYIKMPKKNTDYFSIDAGTTSFKIYASSDGYGNNYLKNESEKGTLVLTAPEGYAIRASGTFGCHIEHGDAHTLCNRAIYDGSIGLVADGNDDSVGVQTVGNIMTLNLNSHGKNGVLLYVNLTVTILPPKTVTLKQTTGGTAEIYNTTSHHREDFYVVATPNAGYLLQGLEIKDGNNVLDSILVNVDWYSEKNSARFSMPDANITVTPVFTNNLTAEGGLYINMPNNSPVLNVAIPGSVESFKLYDDGGKDKPHSEETNEYLKLTAPKGYLIQVTGKVHTSYAYPSCPESISNNDNEKINTFCSYMVVYDGIYDPKGNQNVSLYNSVNSVGSTFQTDLGLIRSTGNTATVFFHASAWRGPGLDLTVEVVPASKTSLSEDSRLDYKEVSRADPLTIYSHMKSDRAFWYTLEARHAVGSDWSDWNVLYDKYDEHALDDHISNDYEIDHSFEIPWQNINSSYEYMEFRYVIDPDDIGGNDYFYTSSVKVRLKNRVNVNVTANNTTSGDYILMTANGTKVDKDQLFDYGTPVKVQAIAPAGFKFLRWANLGAENPVTLSSVVSDTTIRALFEPKNVSDIQVVTYVSQNGSDTWSSAENSPLDVDVTSAKGGNFKVTASVVANEKLCDDGNGSKNCYAYIIIRKEGSDTWDTVEAGNGATYIKVHSGNSYTANDERSVGYSLLKNASRFEIKTIVKPRVSSNTVIAESNSIYANLYNTLRVNEYCYSGGSYIGGALGEGSGSGDCNAIVEDELGNMTTLVPGEKITLPYGSNLKLHPLYPYDMVFYSWKDYSKSNSEVYSYEDYITRDSVYEFTLDSNMTILMGAKYREPDTVRVVPVNPVAPYAGLAEFGVSLSNKGTDGFRTDFASDTAFYIQKFVMGQGYVTFAVNKLDSMFTPGKYSLIVKLVNESFYTTERDSLWWCNRKPAVYFMDEFLAPNTGSSIACSEDSPAVYYRRYDFTVNDTTFNVVFNTWDEENGQYVTVGGTQKVAFGEVPTTPDIDCPESNTAWNFSCDWVAPFAPAVKDTAYTYQVVRSNSAVAVSVEDGVKTATIEGAYDGDDALKITEATTVDKVELNREFSTNGNGFSTIVLPFDFNAEALTGVKSVIEFTGMTKNGDVGMSYIWCDEEVQENIRKEAEADGKGENYDHCNTDKANFPGDMIAYTPYMVQMEDPQIGFGYVGGITLEVTPAKAEARVGDWVFRGTTEKKIFDAEETKDGNVWGFAAKVQDAAKYVGQFVRLGAGASAQPLRAYMVYAPEDSDPPAQLVKASKNATFAAKPAKANSIAGVETAALSDKIDVVIVSRSDKNEEHRTVIGTLTRSTSEFKMLRDYDLKGRKVNGMNRARGAYYGKKVLKK